MRFIPLILAAATLTGCVSINKQALNGKAATEIKNQAVVVVSREKPSFTAMTAGKAAFALLGAAAMISEGNAIISANQVADPAQAIAAELAKALETAHGSRLAAPPVPVESDDVAQVSAKAGGKARYAIDVQTISWSFMYFPTNWARYRVVHTARARLIDTQAKSVVAEGFCKRVPEFDAGAPTYDELLADGAARLKNELATAASDCAKALKVEMLAL